MAATLVVLVLAARVLMQVPDPPMLRVQEPRIQLRLVPRPSAAPSVTTAPAEGTAPAAPVQPGQPSPPDSADGAMPADAPASASPVRNAPASVLARLYDARGQPRLPPGTVPPPAPPATRDILNPPNPVDYRPTRFDEAWVADGGVADRAAQGLANANKALVELLHGKDVQPARARPAPEVRFNPARHERASDLGSAATGDAWRAAPISDEPLPGPGGEASARIRTQLAALERDHAGCNPQRVQQLLAPARRFLGELQRAEHALANGADPIRAGTLPVAARGAWNQARRVLWHARSELADCRS